MVNYMPETNNEDPHHEEFVNEIRKMLIDSGFKKEEIVKQGATEEGPDIIINIKEKPNRILIQCKEALEPSTMYSGIGNLIRTYDSLRREYKANMAMLILKNYDIPEKYKKKEKIKEILKKKKVVYWNHDVTQFYKETVKSLGKPYAKFFILRDMGISIELTKKPIKVKSFQIKQSKRGEPLWIFLIEPKKLLNIAYVFRRGTKDPDAYQRMLNSSRLGDIGSFLSEKNSILANSILVSFEDKNVKYSNGQLSIPNKTCSVWVIDGQHRLYGFSKLDEKLDEDEKKEILKNFKLVAVGIKMKPRIQAKLFTDINSNQRRIDRNLLLDLFDYLDIEMEEGILRRIRSAKSLRKFEPFKNRIKILYTDDGSTTLANIVDYKQFEDIIRKKGSSKLVKDFFQAMKDTFPIEWEDSKNYVFSTNKGIRMLLSLLVRIRNYFENKQKDASYESIKNVLSKLKESTLREPNYFKNETYVGKALGAGSPDLVSRDMWATRIDEKLSDFLSETERNNIMYDSKRILQQLETKLRTTIENKLSTLPNWWLDRVPVDVRGRAEDRKRKNEKIWPWYRSTEKSPLAFVDFSDYTKIILRKNNWELFQPIFRDDIITSSKLKELEFVRNNISHNRKLSSEEMEHLKLYSKDLISCIDNITNSENDISQSNIDREQE